MLVIISTSEMDKLEGFNRFTIEEVPISIIKEFMENLEIENDTVKFILKGCYEHFCFCGDNLIEMFNSGIYSREKMWYANECPNYDGSDIYEFCLQCLKNNMSKSPCMAYVAGKIKVIDYFSCQGFGGETC